MSWLDAIILGILQGLTEFLPVSSSGHLVLLQKLLGIQEHDLAFDVAAHLGTLFSVLIIYRKLFWDIGTNALKGVAERKMNTSLRVCLLVVVGTIPTALIGLSLKSQFEALFSNLPAVGFFLLCTAGLLLLTRRKQYRVQADSLTHMDEVSTMTWAQAITVGVFQGMAIAPGISRSGSTIASGILAGLKGNVAAGFSFMLAVPAILGAAILELKDLGPVASDVWGPLAIGFGMAFVSGLLGLHLVLRFISKGRLEIFSYYLFLVGGGTLLWSLT
ncbi:MAG: undecaprenyl-diphosphate phosphatase [Bdellovibrionaceae bacterium]|nr:undecaprenyl-diphosphate phosphatase [Bdellovibrionales bacterium]MCB9085323.1 undecaprenyl-diphosphate phosphatase [Pseudobdellovibrionaceae bacterium]